MAQPKKVAIRYSDYRDRTKAGKNRTVVEALILAKTREAFLMGLDTIRNRCNPHETISVSWWYAPFIYIDVTDRRYGTDAAQIRFMVSFDITNGLFASTRSENRAECARKGWRNFAEKFIGRKPTYYKSGAQFAPVNIKAE